eukprot:3694334-Rhodomonas_salina.1
MTHRPVYTPAGLLKPEGAEPPPGTCRIPQRAPRVETRSAGGAGRELALAEALEAAGSPGGGGGVEVVGAAPHGGLDLADGGG